MSVIVLVSLSLKEDSVKEFKKFFKETSPDTRSFEGCQGVNLYESKETPTKLIIHAKWVSEEAQQKYIAWRMEKGTFDKVTPMLTEPFTMQVYHILDQ